MDDRNDCSLNVERCTLLLNFCSMCTLFHNHSEFTVCSSLGKPIRCCCACILALSLSKHFKKMTKRIDWNCFITYFDTSYLRSHFTRKDRGMVYVPFNVALASFFNPHVGEEASLINILVQKCKTLIAKYDFLTHWMPWFDQFVV